MAVYALSWPDLKPRAGVSVSRNVRVPSWTLKPRDMANNVVARVLRRPLELAVSHSSALSTSRRRKAGLTGLRNLNRGPQKQRDCDIRSEAHHSERSSIPLVLVIQSRKERPGISNKYRPPKLPISAIGRLRLVPDFLRQRARGRAPVLAVALLPCPAQRAPSVSASARSASPLLLLPLPPTLSPIHLQAPLARRPAASH
jgi:hypothetical protein